MKPIRKTLSVLEETLALHLQVSNIPYEREVTKLVPGRKFRVDFLIDGRLVVECQGGVWSKGGHSTGYGISRDCEKSAELFLNGYPVLTVTREQIESGKALEWVKRGLEITKRRT